MDHEIDYLSDNEKEVGHVSIAATATLPAPSHAASRFLSRTVEAADFGGKKITSPGIRKYLTYEEKSVNKEVDQQRLPNITCSKDDSVDNLWSRGDTSSQPSIELQKKCHVKTVVPSSSSEDTSPSDDSAIFVDHQEGSASFFGKNHEVEPKGAGSLIITLASEDQWEELPRLPPVRLKTEVKLVDIYWEEKYECDALKILDTNNAVLIGSVMEVPIGQEIIARVMLGREMRGHFALKYVYLEHARVGFWGTKQRSCSFDPGGYLAKLLLLTHLIAYWFPP